MAYRNRRQQLINTLKSIANSQHKDFEIIIVDDCSDTDNMIYDISNFLNLDIRVMGLSERKYVNNSCIAYNTAFKAATGDVIIIQNPECYHTGDIISKAEALITEKNYLSFHCYSMDKANTERFISDHTELNDIVNSNNRVVKCDYDNGWYNHKEIRPRGYHFCCAITKENLTKIGGFDMRFADGIGYDDDFFIHKVVKIHKLELTFIDKPFVVHQYHESIWDKMPNAKELVERNRKLIKSLVR